MNKKRFSTGSQSPRILSHGDSERIINGYYGRGQLVTIATFNLLEGDR